MQDNNSFIQENTGKITAKPKLGKLLPDYIDVEKWAMQSKEWQGVFDICQFDRLAEFLVPVEEQQDKPHSEDVQPLCFSVTRVGGVYWLKFSVQARLSVQCQRCLQPMALSLAKESKLALLENKEQASLLSEDDDWLLLEDAAEAVGKEIRLPICRLIEDELLLEIPLAPKHKLNDEHCVAVDVLSDDEPDIDETSTQEGNPFAVLATLKTQLQK